MQTRSGPAPSLQGAEKNKTPNRSNDYDRISFNLVKCQIIIGVSNSQSRFRKSKFSLFVFQTWRVKSEKMDSIRTARYFGKIVISCGVNIIMHLAHTHQLFSKRVTGHSRAHFQPTLHQMQTKKCLHNDIQSWFKQNTRVSVFIFIFTPCRHGGWTHLHVQILVVVHILEKRCEVSHDRSCGNLTSREEGVNPTPICFRFYDYDWGHAFLPWLLMREQQSSLLRTNPKFKLCWPPFTCYAKTYQYWPVLTNQWRSLSNNGKKSGWVIATFHFTVADVSLRLKYAYRRCYAIANSKLPLHESPSATWIDLNWYMVPNTSSGQQVTLVLWTSACISIQNSSGRLANVSAILTYFAMLIPMRGKHSKQVSVQ